MNWGILLVTPVVGKVFFFSHEERNRGFCTSEVVDLGSFHSLVQCAVDF